MNFIRRLWRFLSQPSQGIALGVLLGVGVIAGAILWGGFNWALAVTNTEEFCISCHEMESTVYEELKETPHYSNPSGVRATCPDCHVPKEWGHKVVRKIQATFNELPLHLIVTKDLTMRWRLLDGLPKDIQQRLQDWIPAGGG